jgi:hypothetical protein
VTKPKKSQLKIDSLTLDPRLDVREAGTDADHADRLAEALKSRKTLPPVTVWIVTDPPDLPSGTYHLVTDGRHTVEANTVLGNKTVTCLVREGTWAEALESAALANHGARGKTLTTGDTKRSILMLREARPDLSNGTIADLTGVSRQYVGRITLETCPQVSTRFTPDDDKNVIGKDGKAYPKERRKAPSRRDVNLSTMQSHGLIEANDEVWQALKDAGVRTLGQALDQIAANDLCGLKPGDAADLCEEMKRFAGETAKPSAERNGAPMLYDWKRFDQHFGVVVRASDEIRRISPSLVDSCNQLDKILGEYVQVWTYIKTTITTSPE